MRFTQVNWGEVGERPAWASSGRLFAVWPSPVDHDACLAAAGFGDFADSDEAWDADLVRLVETVIAGLSGWGEPVMTSGDSPDRSIISGLLAAAGDDNFPPCVVTFGARAFVRTSDGHPIVWVSLEGGGIEALLASLAVTWEVRARALRWDAIF
jgi:hypothetical protein